MKTSLPNPPLELLKAKLKYTPSTGSLVWVGSNKEAGCITKNGHTAYRRIRIGGKLYMAHRLIWSIHHQEDPGLNEIDHKNGNGLDNFIDNLRKVSPNVNRRNLTRKKRELPEGVYKARKGDNKYTAQVTHLKTTIHLGTFSSIDLAEKAVARFNHVIAVANQDLVAIEKCNLIISRKTNQ